MSCRPGGRYGHDPVPQISKFQLVFQLINVFQYCNEIVKYNLKQYLKVAKLLYLQKNVIGGFSNYDNYWTSSQSTPETAWIQFFGNGTQSDKGGKDQLYRVRPIKAIF